MVSPIMIGKRCTLFSCSYLGNVQACGVDHSVSNCAQRLKLTGLLQQLLKKGRVMLGAVDCHAH